MSYPVIGEVERVVVVSLASCCKGGVFDIHDNIVSGGVNVVSIIRIREASG